MLGFSFFKCDEKNRDHNLELSFQQILNCLTEAERTSIQKFIFLEDRKRALISILFQHAEISKQFNLKKDDYVILKSKENKPFLNSSRLDKNYQYWNYNVSHHGDYVAYASHPDYLIGIDIVDTSTRSNGINDSMEFFSMFQEQFTSFEFNQILSQVTDDQKYNMFFAYWALKESFIKAIGIGLGFQLTRIEFRLSPIQSTNSFRQLYQVQFYLDGINADDQWKFYLFQFEPSNKYYMSLAIGPLHQAISSYQNIAWKDLPKINDSNNISIENLDIVEVSVAELCQLQNIIL